MLTTLDKPFLYNYGITLATAFLKLNNLPIPDYLTYEEVWQMNPESVMFRRLRKLAGGPAQGTGTGWYYKNTVFVNLKASARAVQNPCVMSWSYPRYKIDRTPTGVVAHETGHHVDEVFRLQGFPSTQRNLLWEKVVKESKRVTGYEPVLSESWAETMRLFILNPDLLRLGSPLRYDYVLSVGLKPSITDDFRTVLDHPAYIAAAEKWITKIK